MRELKAQLIGALLVILTAAAVISAGINFQQQSKFRMADDGAIWVDRTSDNGGRHVEALDTAPNSAAAKAGLRAGDILLKIQGAPVPDAIAVPQALARIGAWNKAEYTFFRDGVEAEATVYVGESVPGGAIYYQYVVGLAYLAIGIFVYFRRGGAHKARHFYLLCLVSFVLCTSFHYTGKLNKFDKVIYWGNVAAGLFAPDVVSPFLSDFPRAAEVDSRVLSDFASLSAGDGHSRGLCGDLLPGSCRSGRCRWWNCAGSWTGFGSRFWRASICWAPRP